MESGRARTRGFAIVGGLGLTLLAACGSDQSNTRVSIHVLQVPLVGWTADGRSWPADQPSPPMTLSTFVVDPGSGAITLTHSRDLEAPAGYHGCSSVQLVGDPQGRFLYLTGTTAIQSYRVDPSDGGLAPVGVPVMTTKPIWYWSAAGATQEHLFLLGPELSVGSWTMYSRMTLAVGSDGTLTSLGWSPRMSDHSDGGYGMIVDPDRRFLYQQRGYSGVGAFRIEPDGSLQRLADGAVADDDELDNAAMVLVRGVLFVRGAGSWYSFALDSNGGVLNRGASRLEPQVVWPFGSTGLVFLRRDNTPELYQVGADAELTAQGTVPDPDHHYGGARILRFHPSFRWAYAMRSDERLGVYAVAGDAALTPIQELDLRRRGPSCAAALVVSSAAP